MSYCSAAVSGNGVIKKQSSSRQSVYGFFKKLKKNQVVCKMKLSGRLTLS